MLDCMPMVSQDTTPLIVTLVKRKLTGGRGCWRAYDVLHDDHGRWLYTPAGSTFRSSDGQQESACEVEGGDGPGLDSVVLVPDGSQHWLAAWRVPQRDLHIGVEVCDWDHRSEQVVAFVDWELDPFRLRSGLVAVEDLDDFVEARDSGLLAAADAQTALDTAAAIERALRRRSTPFDDRGDAVLAEAGTRGLRPLTDVPSPFEV